MEERILFTPVGEIFKNLFVKRKNGTSSDKGRGLSDVLHFSGVIKQLSQESFLVDGKSIAISDETWIIGHLEIGSHATVTALEQADESYMARKIVVKQSDS